MDKEYLEAIAQAEANLNDIEERGEAAIGGDAIEFMKGFFTPEENAACDLRVAIMSEIVKARKEQGITQQRLEEISGIRQPVIARMEKGSVNTKIDTVVRVLAKLGKKLQVVDL